ncbi:hypothetical protein [Lysinibacillus sp. NPDC093692]|uniref:hypothetical protein n=1 Tax=Lysinibacillus sp. NPDC093692 TaxID=3390578 RepID=UPI003CFF17A4
MTNTPNNRPLTTEETYRVVNEMMRKVFKDPYDFEDYMYQTIGNIHFDKMKPWDDFTSVEDVYERVNKKIEQITFLEMDAILAIVNSDLWQTLLQEKQVKQIPNWDISTPI